MLGGADFSGVAPSKAVKTSAVSAGWSGEDHQPLVFCLASSQARPFSTACRTSRRRETLPGSGVGCATADKPPARRATAKHPQISQRWETVIVFLQSQKDNADVQDGQLVKTDPNPKSTVLIFGEHTRPRVSQSGPSPTASSHPIGSKENAKMWSPLV